ncbi:MAG: serine/threonine protein kinase [Candidatus Obscuribacterales bacterium]|nr:serine/threonine protein kinase [Candidatus Obscuribacterales bacterium]
MSPSEEQPTEESLSVHAELDANIIESSLSSANAETEELSLLLSKAAEMELSEADIPLNPFQSLQSSLSSSLTDHKKSTFTALLLGLLGFKILFGPLFFFTFMFWCSIIFLLTRLQRLNSNYSAAVDADGVLITKKDFFGKDVLKIDWQKLHSAELYVDEEGKFSVLLLKPQANSTGFFKRLLFQDLYNTNNEIELRLSKSLAREQSFAEALKNHCPAEKLSSKVEKTSLADELVSTNASVITYHSSLRIERKLNSILKFSEKYLYLAIAAAMLLQGVKESVYSLILLSTLFIAPLSLRTRIYKLLFSAEGIVIAQRSGRNWVKTRLIPWSAIKQVSHSSRQEKDELVEKIEMILDLSKPETKHLKILKLINPGLFKTNRGQTRLSLDLGSISVDDRRKLLNSIQVNVPSEKIESDIAELLNPTAPSSYTELWLDSLGSQSRQFEGTLVPGLQLRNGSYEIKEFLGAGGQASVYLANNLHAETNKLAETLVLKEFILPSHAGAELSKRSLEHVQREFELMQKLKHENIVKYHDIFVEDHRCYLVLEHADGKSLRKIVEEEGALSEMQIISLARQMAELLTHLHSEAVAVVHRDFTPENLILCADGKLKLIDFNVAQELEEGATRTIVGKHNYLPPEQFRGKAVFQSDIYAMGATLYYLLCAEEAEPISCSHPILKRKTLSPALDRIVAKATEPELQDRYLNAQEVLKDLLELNSDESKPG